MMSDTQTRAAAEAPVVLIIDDDTEIRYSLNRVLTRHHYQVYTASSGQEGIDQVKTLNPAVIFLDNRMEGMSGLETLQHLRTLSPKAMIILMTAFGSTQSAIQAMKFGAYDYIIKPFDIKKLLNLTTAAAQAHQDLHKAAQFTPKPVEDEDFAEGMVGVSEKMQDVFKNIGQVAASEFTVLITGESGTGKELVARSIVKHSHLADKPYMAVNCAAIPENLIESELFGHERGAFTGATQQRTGVFEMCDGGTIFLDEIGDMSLSTQTKILRALQEGEIQRVGGSEIIKVKVRLLAATNKDLEAMVETKDFREDLYYRLNVMRIRLPSLRDRREDIPQLVEFMIQKLKDRRLARVKHVSDEALELLRNHRWPGNVRELENVIQRASVMAQGETILVKDLPQEVREPHLSRATRATRAPFAVSDTAPADVAEDPDEQLDTSIGAKPEPDAASSQNNASYSDETLIGTVEDTLSTGVSLEEAYDLLFNLLKDTEGKAILHAIELAMIQRGLKETGGNQVKASALLGITRATLRKRIDQHKLRY